MYNRSVKSYYDKLLEEKQVDIETERLLLKQAKDGALEARNKLVLVNMRGIAAICDCYSNPTVPKEELYGAGIDAFIETIDKLDLEKFLEYDVRLITFARKAIHGAVNDSDERDKGIIKLPIHIKQTIYHVEKLLAKLNTAEYTEEELIKHLAQELNKPVSVIERIFYNYMHLTEFVSFDLQVNDSAYLDFFQTLPELDINVYGDIDAKADLDKLMVCLNEKEKEVVLRRWNILPYRTVGEISKRWGVTRQAVSIRYTRAMKKLKEQALILLDEEKKE